MSKDKETKRLDAEELEKRVAPFAEPLTTRGDCLLPGDEPVGGGTLDKPMKK